MKKLISALLVIVILIMGLFILTGCTNNEDEKSNNEILSQGSEQSRDEINNNEETANPEENNIDLSGYLATKTGKFYSKFNGKMYMEYEMEIEGQKMNMISATNGNKTYSETKLNGVSSGVSIMENGVMYTIDHSNKMIIKMTTNIPDSNTVATSIIEESDVDMNNLKTGTREVEGKTYDTEEMVIEDTSVVMCFDGNDLKYIISSFDGQDYIMKIIKVSDKVDDKLFEIPTGYQILEM